MPVLGLHEVVCPECGGSGDSRLAHYFPHQYSDACNICEGEGKLYRPSETQTQPKEKTMTNPLAPNWSTAEKSGLADNTLKDLMKIKSEVIEAEWKVKELRNGDDREALRIWEKRLESRREAYLKVRSHVVMYGGEAPTLEELYTNEINELLTPKVEEEEVVEVIEEEPVAEPDSDDSDNKIYCINPCKVSDAIEEAWTLHFVATLGDAGKERLLKNAKEATKRMRESLPVKFLEWLSSNEAKANWGKDTTPEFKSAIQAFARGEEGWEAKFSHSNIYNLRYLIFEAVDENRGNPSGFMRSTQLARRLLTASQKVSQLAVVIAEKLGTYPEHTFDSHHLLTYSNLLQMYVFDPEDDGYLNINLITTDDDTGGLNRIGFDVGRAFSLLESVKGLPELKATLDSLEAIGETPRVWMKAWKQSEKGKAYLAKAKS